MSFHRAGLSAKIGSLGHEFDHPADCPNPLIRGRGYYYGGPYVGGGLGTILIIVLIVVLLRGA
jgi:hypothetical protein